MTDQVTESLKTTSNPPEVTVTLLRNEDLPGKSVLLDKRQLPIDILLLTVKDWEFLACISCFNRDFSRSYCKELGQDVYLGKIGNDDMMLKIALVNCYPGSTVPQGSCFAVMKAVEVLKPKAVFIVGCCGGVDPAKVKLGDVVVSVKLTSYSSSKVTDKGITERGVRVPLKNRFSILMLTAAHGWNAPLKSPKEFEVKVHQGVRLIGPESVDSSARREALNQRFPEADVILMEGEGVYRAAQELGIPWTIIKGVSSYADAGLFEPNPWKTFASLMAASLTAHILSDPFIFRDWPHYLSTDLIPAFVLARGEKALAAYHRAIKTGGSTYDKRVKVLLVGQDRVGKTSLGKALRGEPFDEAELSTDGVQMIPAVKNAGTGAWRNPASLEHTTVFDHKIAAETAKNLLGPHSEQPATKQPTETSNKSEPKKPIGGPSNQAVQLSIENGDLIPSTTNEESPPVDQEEEASRQTHHFPRGEEVMPDHVALLLEENLARNELDPEEKIWPVIWDFAGQDIYRAIHPIFMSSEDLYLLAFDLTKKLSEKAVCRVNVGHREHAVTARDDEDTNLDHLLRWMDLIHSLKKGNQKEIENFSHPPVILVGTHADCIDNPSEAMKLVKQTCLRVFCKHSYLPHIRDCLSIDNKNAGKLFNQKDIEKFREAILKVADEMPHTKKPIPLQWHRVEKEISQPKWQRRKFLFKESFRKDIVSRYCAFKNEDDFEELVHFLHSRGTIVYHEHEYDEEKIGLVILDPQWLIKIFCKIINVNPQEKEPMDVEADRTELEEKGILSKKLIDHTCRSESLSPIKDHLISLMDKFNLICRQKTGESQFLVPCMLRTATNEEGENETGSSVPIYLRFQTEYVPNGLFSRLIVLFVKNPQYTNMYELTSNKAKFTLNKNSSHPFQMVRYKSVIKLGFGKGNPPKEDYEDVLRRLDMFLEKLRRECHWLESMSVELCARCTVCIGRKTEACARHEESFCRHHDCGHYIPLVGEVALCCNPDEMLETKPLKPWIEAIEDVSKRSSPSSLLFKPHEFEETPQETRKRSPELDEEIKDGVVSEDDLEGLSLELGSWWNALAGRLRFTPPEIQGFDDARKELRDKSYYMLCRWKEKSGLSGATYKVLYEALCHKYVGCKRLAEKFCIRESPDESKKRKDCTSE